LTTAQDVHDGLGGCFISHILCSGWVEKEKALPGKLTHNVMMV